MSPLERMAPHSRGGTAVRPVPVPRRNTAAPARRGSTAGRPLPGPVRARMEAAFGADFSGVTVREDGAAAGMDAAAFTRGETITFHPGLYEPHTPEGLEMLGHELAHVLQQRAGRVPGTGLTEDPALESEADEAGARAARGAPVSSPVVGDRPGPSVLTGSVASAAATTALAPADAVAQPQGFKKFLKRLFGRRSSGESAQGENPYGSFQAALQARGAQAVNPVPAQAVNQYANIPPALPAPASPASQYANIPSGLPGRAQGANRQANVPLVTQGTLAAQAAAKARQKTKTGT
jgi:Domain of unknown function (DUF4157)